MQIEEKWNQVSTHSLGFRMVIGIIAISSFFTLIVVGIQLYLSYREDITEIERNMRQIASGYQSSLTRSLWDIDYDQIYLQMEGIRGFQNIEFVRIETDKGSSFEAGTKPPQVMSLTLNYPLKFKQSNNAAEETVGTLIIYSSLKETYKSLQFKALVYLASQGIKTFFASALILVLFYLLIGRHLSNLADYAKKLNVDNLDNELHIKRKKSDRKADELDSVVGALNDMRITLREDLEQRKKIEHELRGYQEDLEGMVKSRTLELEKVNQQLEQLATTDGLTNLANRRHFDEKYQYEINRSIRFGHPLSLLLCDIDYFKRFNDYYGHQAGDNCLCQVANIFAQVFKRPCDLAARYGGEEFIVLLPGTSIEGAEVAAEKLRMAILNLQIPHVNSLSEPFITISIGTGCKTFIQGETGSFLIELTDKALYKAKENGRNQVQRVAGVESDTSPIKSVSSHS